jgi:hypothetical protein
MNSVISLVRMALPFPQLESVSRYIKRYSAIPNYAENFSALEAESRGGDIEQQKELLAHALRYMLDEDARAASIIGRAQALLVAQTFFGVLLAFGTAMIGRAEIFTGHWLTGLLCMLGYLIAVVVLLTFNALRATRGLDYVRIGSSDLRKMISMKERLLVNNLALLTLQSYRHAHIVNTWRAIHLRYAQTCLAIITILLGLLVSFLLFSIVTHRNVGTGFE